MAWPDFYFVLVVPEPHELPGSERNRFVSLARKRCWAEAVGFYESLLTLRPDFSPALNALAMVAYENRDYDAASGLLIGLLKKFPQNPVWLNNFAVVAAVRGEFKPARMALQLAWQTSGGKTEVLYNQGCLSLCEGDPASALQRFRQVINVERGHKKALFALSRVTKESGLVEESIVYCRRLVELAPENAEYRQNLGLMLLKKGEWDEGLELYESRWQANNLSSPFTESLWQGEPLAGKTILVWAEQGLGDTINFARYLSSLQEKGGLVAAAVQPPLRRLLTFSFPGVRIVDLKKKDSLAYDYQVPFLSLPYYCSSRLEDLPAKVPYLRVPDSAQEKWRPDISGSGLKVGVVWAGNPRHANDKNRSIPLEQFSTLFPAAGAKFYVLQKEFSANDEKMISDLVSSPGDHIVDLSEKLDDFSDTAAILRNLDLLLTVDTSVAHLGGALACPTWLLLPFDTDWRWLLEREDSPWYPTMRLFRQQQKGDWAGVMAQVKEALDTTLTRR
ncbi:MAG: tetratricopeptide repeat protein [Desulfobacterales bacterium]|nr:tetratricopeptide repeat protein [Desulfobacterales bacterium]